MHWKKLLLLATLLEFFTLIVQFWLPYSEGRAFVDPAFPQLIVFHQSPPGCIVDFRGNFWQYVAEETFTWLVVTFLFAFIIARARTARIAHKTPPAAAPVA